MMRNLLLSSFAILVIFGCGSPSKITKTGEVTNVSCINNLVPEYKTVLYNSQINVTGKHLSGLLLFKKMNDGSTRAVFTNETGVTLFDFEFGINNFKVIYIIDKMNRKPVITQLSKDLGLLIRYQMQNVPDVTMRSGRELYFGYKKHKETIWYITPVECKNIEKISVESKKKEKVSVSLKNFGTTMPDTVYIDHKGFEFNISLQKIER